MCYKGDEVKQSVLKGKEISKFLSDNLEEIEEILSMLQVLILWYDIDLFLKNRHVSQDKVESFSTLINEFKANIKSFYNCRASSFMTEAEVGDDRIHYLHCLRYHIPTIAKQT